MLFVLNEQGVPSVGHIARISAQAAAQTQDAVSALRKPAAAPIPPDLVALDTKIAEEQGRPPVVVGITPSCPYGICACWGGAFAALRQLSDVDIVRPLPDTADSIAFVYSGRTRCRTSMPGATSLPKSPMAPMSCAVSR
jgi:galactose oxidase